MNLAEIWDTPGYFYAVGYSLSTFVGIAVLRPPMRSGWRWLSRIAMLALLVPLMTLTKNARGLPFVAVMLTAVAVILGSFFLTLGNWLRALYYGIKAFIYGELASSLCWLIYYYLALRWTALQALVPMLACMLVLFAAIFAAVFLLERWLHRSGMQPQITLKDLWIEGLAAVSVYVVSNMGYLQQGGMFSGSFARDIFAIRTLVDLSGAILIIALESQLIETQLRLENAALNSIMQSQYQAYQLSRESMDMVNRKYHDLKHQIALLRAEAASPKSEEYLRSLELEIQGYENMHRTGHPVLDAIIAQKAARCQRQGIELKFIVDGGLLGFMDDMEISALFGNMLDNAIEAVERIGDARRRLIRLNVTRENRFLRIRIENCCDDTLRFQDGLPLTTKGDLQLHGFGMKSMRTTVEKYGGSLMADQADGWFRLMILIPMNTNEPEKRGST